MARQADVGIRMLFLIKNVHNVRADNARLEPSKITEIEVETRDGYVVLMNEAIDPIYIPAAGRAKIVVVEECGAAALTGHVCWYVLPHTPMVCEKLLHKLETVKRWFQRSDSGEYVTANVLGQWFNRCEELR